MLNPLRVLTSKISSFFKSKRKAEMEKVNKEFERCCKENIELTNQLKNMKPFKNNNNSSDIDK